MRLRKFFAKLFVIVSTFFVVLSPIVLVEEAHHSCTHEDCQICEVIRTAKETIKQVKYTPAVSAIVLVAVTFILLTIITAIVKNIDFTSLITLKTKLTF